MALNWRFLQHALRILEQTQSTLKYVTIYSATIFLWRKLIRP